MRQQRENKVEPMPYTQCGHGCCLVRVRPRERPFTPLETFLTFRYGDSEKLS